MPSTTVQKFRIRENDILYTINAPADFKKKLGSLPQGVRIINEGVKFNQVHWFVKNKADLQKGMKKLMAMVKGDVVCWIYFPKGTSGIQTDLTRDTGYEEIMKQGKQWINLVSFDETWSAFGLREKTEADLKKESGSGQRPIFDYVDPKTKSVSIPEDLAAAFKKYKKEAAYFNGLAFSHKKEYIEWIITAKREETRAKRVKGTIEMLGRDFKNPREASLARNQ